MARSSSMNHVVWKTPISVGAGWLAYRRHTFICESHNHQKKTYANDTNLVDRMGGLAGSRKAASPCPVHRIE